MKKLDKKSKEILQMLVKGKGFFKTPTVPKDHTDKKSILDLEISISFISFELANLL